MRAGFENDFVRWQSLPNTPKHVASYVFLLQAAEHRARVGCSAVEPLLRVPL
jgi:hypothetical protein